MPQLPDYQLNQYFTDLMTKAKIEPKLKFKFESEANSFDLFGSKTPLLDTLCKGASLHFELDVWKGFALSQIKLFTDKNMLGALIIYLFGTTPFSMIQV